MNSHPSEGWVTFAKACVVIQRAVSSDTARYVSIGEMSCGGCGGQSAERMGRILSEG
jgi:hypothetical protein